MFTFNVVSDMARIKSVIYYLFSVCSPASCSFVPPFLPSLWLILCSTLIYILPL